MDTDFKVGDCVQLINGYSPDMTIAEIYPELKEAKCVWFDVDIQEYKDQDLPLSVIKKCPQQPTLSDIIKAI